MLSRKMLLRNVFFGPLGVFTSIIVFRLSLQYSLNSSSTVLCNVSGRLALICSCLNAAFTTVFQFFLQIFTVSAFDSLLENTAAFHISTGVNNYNFYLDSVGLLTSCTVFKCAKIEASFSFRPKSSDLCVALGFLQTFKFVLSGELVVASSQCKS